MNENVNINQRICKGVLTLTDWSRARRLLISSSSELLAAATVKKATRRAAMGKMNFILMVFVKNTESAWLFLFEEDTQETFDCRMYWKWSRTRRDLSTRHNPVQYSWIQSGSQDQTEGGT
jgi:hypothetical protein